MHCRFYIGVACREHVSRGVEQGICQFCHGKQAPAKKLNKGDYIVYYSSKVSMEAPNSESYQKFTAIGRIIDDTPYRFDMGGGFIPYRRNVSYFKDSQGKEPDHLSIHPLISAFSFITNKKSWGYVFRYGFLEIDYKDFDTISTKMLGYNPSANLSSLLDTSRLL